MKFRSSLLLLALAGVASMSVANAAERYPAPVPGATWTGFYAGLNAGGNWGTSNASTIVFPNGPAGFGPPFLGVMNAVGAPTGFATSGFTGGVHGGYNWQSGNWLAGFEVDFEYFRSSVSKTTSGSVPSFAGSSINVRSSISTDWLATVRPRLGIVSNNGLLYTTGGLALTRVNASWSLFGTSGAGIGDTIAESASASPIKAGWVVGAGVEAALPGNWLIGAEYLYVNFDNVSASSPNIPDAPFGSAPNIVNHSADLQSNIVRMRLSRKF